MKPASLAFSKKIQVTLTTSETGMFSLGGELIRKLYHGTKDAEFEGIPGGFFRENATGKTIEFWFQFYYCGYWNDGIQSLDQLDGILKIIESIRSANRKIESLYIIVSTRFDNIELRDRLSIEIKEKFGDKLEEAQVFNPKDFINFIFGQVDSELRDNVLAANQRFAEEYKVRMEQFFYLPNVPFLNSSNDVKQNPISYIDEILNVQQLSKVEELLSILRAEGKHTTAQPDLQKTFIVSEFGFGKTTLLLQYATHLRAKNLMPVYLPMSLLPRKLFDLNRNFAQSILELILEESLNEEDLFDGLRTSAFVQMLRIRRDIVWLFDGLDEHPIAYRPDGLHRMIRCLKDFKQPCLFSVRKEFWDAKRERIEDAFSPNRKRYEKIELLEWPNDIILDFLEKYGAHVDDTKNIQAFKVLVASNKYEYYYGDIPKRPLFLEMLVRDIVSDEIKKRNLAQLYEGYFREKFRLGRKTFNEKMTGRPMPPNMEIEQVIDNMLWVMEQAASMMLSSDKHGNIEFVNQISAASIEQIWKEAGINDDISLFLHSLLITFGKHELTGLKVKFAHKSFQEYFTARYFAKVLLSSVQGEPKDEDWLSRHNITEGVPRFLEGILETLQKEERTNCCAYLKRLIEGGALENSIVGRLGGIID